MTFSTEFAVICEHVAYTYPNGTKAVRDVSLSIAKGEKAAIIGPNGAGKSTFLTLLNGVRRPQGQINIFGIPVIPKHYREVRTHIGLAFQNPDDHLFCPTVYDDIAFGPLNMGISKEDTDGRVRESLEEFDLSDKMYSHSLNLSYGERKLISLASILSMRPRLIALDEPTGNLDAWHRRKLINWIKDYRETVIMTTHDLDLALETCDRVFIFNQGKVAASGDCQSILTDGKLLNNNKLELPLQLQSIDNKFKPIGGIEA